MKRKVTVQIPIERQGLFGKKTVMEKRTIEVDGATWKKMQKEAKDQPFGLDEMILYDEIFDEWDD